MKKHGVAWVSGFAPTPPGLNRRATHCPVRHNAARVTTVRTATTTPARMHAGHEHGTGGSTEPAQEMEAVEVTWDGSKINADALVESVKFNSAGLVAAIAQQVGTGEVLMMAWMNEESIRETMASGRAVYFSRSRQKLWRKGETSGQVQVLRDVVLDCDGDTLLLSVHQIGVACHTGRRSCFYTAYRPPYGDGEVIADVLIDPNALYGSSAK